MKLPKSESKEFNCSHDNVKREGAYIVCLDCGEVLEEEIAFAKNVSLDSDIQRDYERSINIRDSKAMQDPIIKQKYDKIQMLEKWFRDYQTNFSEQKKTIELLKSYKIGLNIDSVKLEQIKKRYLKYNKNHRRTYQNMVIIFLAIVWMEIKDTTNVRIESYIEVCNELGHKINKKMLNNAMAKIRKAEIEQKRIKELKTKDEIEEEIKEKIKILFQKDLNAIPLAEIEQNFKNKSDYEKIKIEMQLKANEILNKISYENLRNINYKAFTAGLIYYVGQTLPNRKVFTQSLVEETTKFSSTTIRKKYKILKKILGSP